MDPDDVAHKRQLLGELKRRKQLREEQLAELGISADPSIHMEIEDLTQQAVVGAVSGVLIGGVVGGASGLNTGALWGALLGMLVGAILAGALVYNEHR